LNALELIEDVTYSIMPRIAFNGVYWFCLRKLEVIGNLFGLFVLSLVAFKPWLHVKYDYFEIVSKLFRCFLSHATTSETEIKLFLPPKLFPIYFSNIEHRKYS